MDRGGRVASGCAVAACASVPGGRMRFGSASLLERLGPDPAQNLRAVSLHEPSVPRPPGTARALVRELSLASFALSDLVVLALGRGSRAPVYPATDTIKAVTDGHCSADKPCRVWGLPAAPGGAAPSLGAQCSRRESAATRRRRRCAAHVARQRSPGALRADAVVQQESRDAEAADTVNKRWAGSSARP